MDSNGVLRLGTEKIISFKGGPRGCPAQLGGCWGQTQCEGLARLMLRCWKGASFWVRKHKIKQNPRNTTRCDSKHQGWPTTDTGTSWTGREREPEGGREGLLTCQGNPQQASRGGEAVLGALRDGCRVSSGVKLRWARALGLLVGTSRGEEAGGG